jgi:hypothetical protein
VICGTACGASRRHLGALGLLATLLALSLTSCGGGSNGGGCGGGGGQQPTKYAVTIQGTSGSGTGSLVHNTIVDLVVSH